jgi:hypothetical protein
MIAGARQKRLLGVLRVRQYGAVVAPPFPQVRYLERTRLPLDEGAPDDAWLDLIRFLFDPDTTDQFTLDLLLTNAHYRDDYLIVGSPLARHGTRHGPYRIDCLATESYELSDRPSAEETLYRWAEGSARSIDQPYPAPIRTAETITEAATTIFHLNVLREGCEHEDGALLGDFHEFVLLNRHDGILTVLVASATLNSTTLTP